MPRVAEGPPRGSAYGPQGQGRKEKAGATYALRLEDMERNLLSFYR